MENLVARRVVAVSNENNSIECPTGGKRPIENKAQCAALSNRKTGSNLSKYMQDAYKRMSRMLGYSLTLGTADAWSGFSFVAEHRLSETERAALAYAVLMSLPHEQVELAAAAVLNSIGSPLPAFLGDMDEARWWASYASRNELKAYALAAHDAMSTQDQAAFFRHISEVEIAA